MSAIAGIFGPPLGRVAEESLVRQLSTRGSGRSVIHRMPGATLVVARHEWEWENDGGIDSAVIDDGRRALVADATIYYREELLRRIGRGKNTLRLDSNASTLIHAACRSAGDAAPSMLEGDFAFLFWDRVLQRLSCARDFGGKRPLYYATFGDNIAVASTVGALVSLPGVRPSYNLPVLAETCAQWWSGSAETCYTAVRELPAGATLLWSVGGSVAIERHWSPPSITPSAFTNGKLKEGAEELASLLRRATAERISSEGPTAVWMSGGWDSSAVFAAGQSALHEMGRSRQSVTPVSISYPPGDPGREDELISAIADRWNSKVNWLIVDEIPLFRDPVDGARHRDLPFAHTYEHWNRALAHASRATGARVAFDGNGGDQLFQISDVFMADLLRAGRWWSVAREWQTKGGRGAGTFLDWVIAPALPRLVRQPLLAMLGRHSADDLTRPVPSWIRRDFVSRHALVERERAAMPRKRGYRGWRSEAHHFLSAPVFPRAFQTLAGFALDAGVELRSPLYDGRVIQFACTRPREERNSGRETKRVLRAAMRGLLPDEVLAPRPRRTGITTAYSDRRMLAEFPLLLARHGKMQMLADLGIVEPNEVVKAWTQYCHTGDTALKIPLFLTMHVELWMKARAGECDPRTRQEVVREKFRPAGR